MKVGSGGEDGSGSRAAPALAQKCRRFGVKEEGSLCPCFLVAACSGLAHTTPRAQCKKQFGTDKQLAVGFNAQTGNRSFLMVVRRCRRALQRSTGSVRSSKPFNCRRTAERVAVAIVQSQQSEGMHFHEKFDSFCTPGLFYSSIRRRLVA